MVSIQLDHNSCYIENDGTYVYYVLLLLDQSDKMISLALVIFKFDEVEDHSVLVHPHGNAKSNYPYQRTKENTKNFLKA